MNPIISFFNLLLYHFFGDFGLSIIILTLVIYLLLLPLTVGNFGR